MKSFTQTICTIGPSSEDPQTLEKLALAGMDVARLNFSHATYDQYSRIQKSLRKINAKHHKNVKLMMDLQGPRMRVGKLPEKGIELKDGQTVTFSTDPENKKAIHIDDPYLHSDIKVNHPIFLANGEMELLATKVANQEIAAQVIRGGVLYSRKGVNVPETDLTTRGLTPKDMEDIAFGVKSGVDFIAMSFVRDEIDLNYLREIIDSPKIKIVPKIERKQAISNLEGIIRVSDVIMVARGDLGVEIPVEEVPLLQKEIILRAKRLGKPSIVATQMLMSMVNHAHPTRAEISDVANAVLDGAQYVMLSDETAFGSYPVEALEYLVKTSRRAQEFISHN